MNEIIKVYELFPPCYNCDIVYLTKMLCSVLSVVSGTFRLQKYIGFLLYFHRNHYEKH